MKKNEIFHSEELYNPKRPRRYGVISQAQNHAKLRPRVAPLNNEIYYAFSPTLSLYI